MNEQHLVLKRISEIEQLIKQPMNRLFVLKLLHEKIQLVSKLEYLKNGGKEVVNGQQ